MEFKNQGMWIYLEVFDPCSARTSPSTNIVSACIYSDWGLSRWKHCPINVIDLVPHTLPCWIFISLFACKIEPLSISNEAVQLIPKVGPYHPPTHLLHLPSPQYPNKNLKMSLWRHYRNRNQKYLIDSWRTQWGQPSVQVLGQPSVKVLGQSDFSGKKQCYLSP